MVRTRGGVNTSENATKGKKKVVETSSETCKEDEPQVVEVKAQKLKGQKKEKTKGSRGKGSKAPAMTKRRRGRAGDSTSAEAEIVVDLLEHTAAKSVIDPMGNTNESSNLTNNVVSATVVDNFERGDVNVDTTMEDVEGMAFYVPSSTGTEDVTAGNDDNVTPRIFDTGIDAADLPEERTGKTNLNKRKHKTGADAGEPFEPKKKLSKEERAAKRVERKARKADEKIVEEKAADDDVHEMVEDQVPLKSEPRADSDEEDVSVVISRRRKGKGKLKLNENKTRVGNKRIPKNVAEIFTTNVALNSKEEEAKWKFVVSRRIAVERILFEVTKKNADIMGILEDTGVMPTVETVGPYYPKLVREFIGT
ncbi:hypothetical protein LIER_21296 [Lithospermum erythrorhizon]|uniref:Envelope-like protein n=1 Tax=Lithospermum erythrorhizon TaxID=34254 RepID=A0AAV3QSL2_LITER